MSTPFSDWKARVYSYLDVDATRVGFEILRDSLLRAVILDLQHYIPCFRDGTNTGLYGDGDSPPFVTSEKAAEAAGLFMKAKLARRTEKDLSLAADYRKEYELVRRQLIRECQEQQLSGAITDGNDDAITDGSGVAITDGSGDPAKSPECNP